MKYTALIGAVVAALALGGCAKTQTAMDNHNAEIAPDPKDVETEAGPPLTADTHFAAGQLAESRGDLHAAVTQYQDALKLDEHHMATLYRLGCTYVQLKSYGEAMAVWHRYLEATDNSAFAYSNLAFTEELAGLPQKAEQDYQRGVARDPNNEPCRVNFGLMLARHGRVPEAIIQLQAVLDAAEVHFNIASVYELQNRPAMAKLEYKRALAVDPNFADAKEKLASLGGVESAD